MNNKEIIRDFYERVVSGNLIDEIDKYVAANCSVRTGHDIIPAGVEGMKQHVIDVRKTYQDMKIRIIRQYAEGDYVISEIIMEGIHSGEWMGIKPTGKKLSITGVNIDRLAEGMMVEHGGAANTFDTFWAERLIQPWS